MLKYVSIGIVLIFIIFSPQPAEAEDDAAWEYTLEDPAGDDYGPGSYQYPDSEVFSEKEGLFDLLEFQVIEEDDKQQFKFKFENLTDPWDGKFGFSLPLIQIYVDNDEGGSEGLFQEGANINFVENFSWNRLFKLSGWWLRVYRPGDDADDFIDFHNDVGDNPREIKDADVTVDDNTIKVNIDKEIMGSLENSRIYLLVGGFDPFGPDHFRDIRTNSSSWEFHDTSDKNLNYATRVIDIVVPEGKEQKEVLVAEDDGFPRPEPIKLDDSKEAQSFFLNKVSYMLFILLAAAAFFYYRNQSTEKENKN